MICPDVYKGVARDVVRVSSSTLFNFVISTDVISNIFSAVNELDQPSFLLVWVRGWEEGEAYACQGIEAHG